MNYLQNGQKLETEFSKSTCIVNSFIAEGGQGEVYKATLSDLKVAVKWYFPVMSNPQQKSNINLLINTGTPSKNFLWPIDIVSLPDPSEGFGYIMDLIPDNYKSLGSLVSGKANVTSFKTIAEIGFQLANNFLMLHMKGLCYGDISFNNIFFDPKTGNILIIDNDNVGVNNETLFNGGTQGFMAPEIVRGEARPSIETDRFSLAILLFYLFMLSDPFLGKRELDLKILDDETKNILYGKEPIFIFDPENANNRPVKTYHDNAIVHWEIYPEPLKNLFITSFTGGLNNPRTDRIVESQWKDAMIEFRDSIFYCSNCKKENFYDVVYLRHSRNLKDCWNCKQQSKIPPRIRLKGKITMLNHDTKLYPHHINQNDLYNFSIPVAEISINPNDPSILGLKNLSSKNWTATAPDLTLREINPGKSIKIVDGLKINFGNEEGVIRLGF